jgi:threonine dehydrogenase-like Zn-dependent dehydrogenase
VDQRCHDHHRSGRHVLDTSTARDAYGRPVDTSTFVTHRYGLDEMMDAYDIFADPADIGSLKVALFRTR